jgi:lipopolysaccharide export system permease protein
MFESAGFSAKKHRYHLYKLFSFPFLLAAMSLLGVSFNLNNFARKKTSLLFLAGIITGFFIFYITKIINALSLAGKMPLLFGSVLPIILPLFLAIALIIHADEK